MIDDPNLGAAVVPSRSAPLVAIYWLIVVLPLAWGVYQTVQKSIPLFHVTASGSQPPAGAGTTSTPR